jgi:hypothetical protein
LKKCISNLIAKYTKKKTIWDGKYVLSLRRHNSMLRDGILGTKLFEFREG